MSSDRSEPTDTKLSCPICGGLAVAFIQQGACVSWCERGHVATSERNETAVQRYKFSTQYKGRYSKGTKPCKT